MRWETCDICDRGDVSPGVFSSGDEPTFRSPWKRRDKHVFKTVAGAYYWGAEQPPGATVCDSACSTCLKDLRGGVPPTWSAVGSMGHGVPVPPELVGLTYAEEALISRIQSIVAVKMLKFGQRAMTGMAVFVDRMGTITGLATDLPLLARDRDKLCLVARS